MGSVSKRYYLQSQDLRRYSNSIKNNMRQRRIIDSRRKAKFMMDDEFINDMAKLCGWQGTIVYCSLCRHSNKDQESFPSISLMAEQYSVSRPTIIKGIGALEKRNLIAVGKTRSQKSGKWLNNTYTLLDKSEWTYDPNGEMTPATVITQVNVNDSTKATLDTNPSQCGSSDQVNPADSKDTHGKGNTYSKETHSMKNADVFLGNDSIGKDSFTNNGNEIESTTGSKVNEVLELFRPIFYGDFIGAKSAFKNTTTREAVEALLKRYTLEQIKELIRKYDAGKTDQYRPEVDTVLEFCTKKLARVESYVSKIPTGQLWAQRSISTPEQRADSDRQIHKKIEAGREKMRKSKEEWILAHPGEPLFRRINR